MLIRFSEYLLEAKQWSVKDFQRSIASSHTVEPYDQAYAEKLRTVYIPRLIQYFTEYATGDVPNPRYAEIKYAASFVVERATDIPANIMDMIRKTQINTWDYEVAYPHEVPGKLKRAEAAAAHTTNANEKVFFAWLVPILKELLPVAEMMEDIKKRVVKRQPKAPVDINTKYQAPMVSTQAGRLVREVLQKLTDDLKGEYAKHVAKYLVNSAEEYAQLTRAEQLKQYTYYHDVVAARDAWESTANRLSTLKAGYKKVFKRAADEAANNMQAQFIEKNTIKLANILKQKNVNLKGGPKIIHLAAGRGVFEGEIHVVFVDGAEFTVRNKIVWKRNNYGTAFNQFPTTFHNVKLAGGKPMPQPSEERMNTVFAK